MKAHAILRNHPVSPRKMRRVANLVRGEQISRALFLLKFQPSPNAHQIEKLLLSAVANWQAKYADKKVAESDLYVQEVRVDIAPMLKRYKPAPHGRAQRIRKRANHLTLCVCARIQPHTSLAGAKDGDASVSTPTESITKPVETASTVSSKKK